MLTNFCFSEHIFKGLQLNFMQNWQKSYNEKKNWITRRISEEINIYNNLNNIESVYC